MDKIYQRFPLILVLVALLLIGFFLRINNLGVYSFWVDEANSASFARAILQRGTPTIGGFTDWRYPLHFYLTAFSMKFFGFNEFAARLPSVIFGTLAILGVYFLGKKLINRVVGLSAAIFTAFSILEITWSRQARGYAPLQLFYLLAFYFFLRWIASFDKEKFFNKWLFLTTLFVILAILTHPLGWLLLVSFIVFLVLFKRSLLRENILKLQRWQLLLLIIVGLSIFYSLNLFKVLSHLLPRSRLFFNHFRYYRVFFWHEYNLISFMAFLGLTIGLVKNSKKFIPVFLILLVYFGFIFFYLDQPFVRYPFVVFPLFFILASYFLWYIFKKPWILLLLVLFIVANGYKFTLLGEKYYSLNSDMQEVPEPDFRSAYLLVKEKLGQLENPEEVIIISSAFDPSEWYLGTGATDYLLNQMPFFDQNCEKYHNAYGRPIEHPDARTVDCVNSVEKIKRVIEENPNGFIIIDRTVLTPLEKSITDYLAEDLKLEFHSERISLDIEHTWPVEVYSWGID